ncbi:hypothetical protein JCM8097_009244 [Rhodosporidiobolus ruineniae]
MALYGLHVVREKFLSYHRSLSPPGTPDSQIIAAACGTDDGDLGIELHTVWPLPCSFPSRPVHLVATRIVRFADMPKHLQQKCIVPRVESDYACFYGQIIRDRIGKDPYEDKPPGYTEDDPAPLYEPPRTVWRSLAPQNTLAEHLTDSASSPDQAADKLLRAKVQASEGYQHSHYLIPPSLQSTVYGVLAGAVVPFISWSAYATCLVAWSDPAYEIIAAPQSADVPPWCGFLEQYYVMYHPVVWTLLEDDQEKEKQYYRDLGRWRLQQEEDGASWEEKERVQRLRIKSKKRLVWRFAALYGLHYVRQRFLEHHRRLYSPGTTDEQIIANTCGTGDELGIALRYTPNQPPPSNLLRLLDLPLHARMKYIVPRVASDYGCMLGEIVFAQSGVNPYDDVPPDHYEDIPPPPYGAM